jgi:hypothetical protein
MRDERIIIKKAIDNNPFTKFTREGTVVHNDDCVSWAMNDGSKYFSVNGSLFPYRYAPKSGRLFKIDSQDKVLRTHIASVIAKANDVAPKTETPKKQEVQTSPEKWGKMVTQLDYNGVPEKLPADEYTIEFTCPTCLGTRYVKPTDAFQVKFCKPCQKKAAQAHKNRRARERRAAKKAAT